MLTPGGAPVLQARRCSADKPGGRCRVAWSCGVGRNERLARRRSGRRAPTGGEEAVMKTTNQRWRTGSRTDAAPSHEAMRAPDSRPAAGDTRLSVVVADDSVLVRRHL